VNAPEVVPPVGVTETLAEGLLVPAEFVAVTVHEYVVPLDSPRTTIGLAVPVPVNVALPSVHVAVYPVIAAPPFDAGAVKATVALPLPAVEVRFVGGPGASGLLPGRNSVCRVLATPFNEI